MDNKKRTISYLRAVWPPGQGQTGTLEQALRTALQSLPNAGETRISKGERHVEVRHRELSGSQVRLHIAAWTGGESISTVPHKADKQDADLSSLAPGEDWDYLDGDGMVLVADNHCLLMPSGLLLKSMENYLKNLLQKCSNEGANIPDNSAQFRLVSIASPPTVKIIREQGIKQFDLNVAQYRETIELGGEDGRPKTILRYLTGDLWKLLIADEKSRKEILEASNVTASLIVKLNTRRPGLEAGELADIVRPIIEEEGDQINIVTGTGQRIRSGKLLLKETVTVEQSTKTVSHLAAWRQMGKYFAKLKDDGILEE